MLLFQRIKKQKRTRRKPPRGGGFGETACVNYFILPYSCDAFLKTRTRCKPPRGGGYLQAGLTAAVPTYGGNAIAVVGVPIRTLFHVFITKSRSRDFCFCFV